MNLKLEDTHLTPIQNFGKPDLLVLHSQDCIATPESTLVVIELKKRRKQKAPSNQFENADYGQIGEKLRIMKKKYGIAFGILTNGSEIVYMRAIGESFEKCTRSLTNPLHICNFIRLAASQRRVPSLPKGAINFYKQNSISAKEKVYIQQILGRGASCEVWSVIREVTLADQQENVMHYGNVLNIADTNTAEHLQQNASIIQLLCNKYSAVTPQPFPSLQWCGYGDDERYYMLTSPEGRRFRPKKHRLTVQQIKDVLTALACLHDMGYVHRDVEARNIILVEGSRSFAMLVDYSAIAHPKVRVVHAGCSLCVPPEILEAKRRKKKIYPVFSHDLWSFIAVCSRMVLRDDALFRCVGDADKLEKYWRNIVNRYIH